MTESQEAFQLAQYAVNSPEIYANKIAPVILKLARHKAVGSFDPALSINSWARVAQAAALDYTKSIKGEEGLGHFTKPVRMRAAAFLARHYGGKIERTAFVLRGGAPI